MSSDTTIVNKTTSVEAALAGKDRFWTQFALVEMYENLGVDDKRDSVMLSLTSNSWGNTLDDDLADLAELFSITDQAEQAGAMTNSQVQSVEFIRQSGGPLASASAAELLMRYNGYSFFEVLGYDGQGNHIRNSMEHNQVFAAFMDLSPNPANERVMYNILVPVTSSARIEIRDALGKIVYEHNPASRSGVIECTHLQNGVYFVSLLDHQDLLEVQKLIVAK